MIDHDDWLLAWHERDLEQKQFEYERELREELEDDWAKGNLRITYEHVLEALGISLTLTDEQHDDGLTFDELEELLAALGIHLNRKQQEKLTDTVLDFYYYLRY